MTTALTRSLDLPLGPGRTLRVTLVEAEHGDAVVLASGFGGRDTGREFSRPSWGDAPQRLPASIVPPLVAALEQLMSEHGDDR